MAAKQIEVCIHCSHDVAVDWRLVDTMISEGLPQPAVCTWCHVQYGSAPMVAHPYSGERYEVYSRIPGAPGVLIQTLP